MCMDSVWLHEQIYKRIPVLRLVSVHRSDNLQATLRFLMMTRISPLGGMIPNPERL